MTPPLKSNVVQEKLTRMSELLADLEAFGPTDASRGAAPLELGRGLAVSSQAGPAKRSLNGSIT